MTWGIVQGGGTCSRGKYDISIDGKLTKWRRTWGGMLERCYSGKWESYKDCFVNQVFLDFQSFMLWAETQKGFYESGWQLDKDLLFKGNREYSPQTCVFLPREINTALVIRKSCRVDSPIGISFREGWGGICCSVKLQR